MLMSTSTLMQLTPLILCCIGSAGSEQPVPRDAASAFASCSEGAVHPDVAKLMSIMLSIGRRGNVNDTEAATETALPPPPLLLPNEQCTLSPAELLRYFRAVGGADRPPHAAAASSSSDSSMLHVAAVLQLLDEDNDGRLSLRELAAVARGSKNPVPHGPHDPQQVHIAPTGKAGEMRITFATCCGEATPSAGAQVWLESGGGGAVFKATPHTYAVPSRWWQPKGWDGWLYTATVDGLAPGARYSYTVSTTKGEITPQFSFRAPPAAVDMLTVGERAAATGKDCSPSFASDKCNWKTKCAKGQSFWNTPYQGTSCVWQFNTGILHPVLTATFRAAYAVNITVYDGESVDSSPVLATWDGPAHPGKDDGTIEAQSKRSGGVLTVKVEAAGSCPTFGLMFDYNIHPPKDEEDEKWPAVAAAVAAEPTTFATWGDMGTFMPLGFAVMDKVVQVHNNTPFDFVLHQGDIAYAGVDTAIPELNITKDDELELIWDLFGRQIEAVAATTPYITGVGNHEAWYNFSSFTSRYPMPDRYDQSRLNLNRNRNSTSHSHSNPPFWFSYDHGLVHVVSLSSEHDYWSPHNPQVAWAEADLAAAANNRENVPWIVVAIHRPFYSSDKSEYEAHAPGAPLLKAFESMMVKHGVDLTLTGHEHAYERVHPNINGTVVSTLSSNGEYIAPKAPVHLMIGSAGAMQEESWVQPRPVWSAVRWAVNLSTVEHIEDFYGFGVVTCRNASYLKFEFVPISNNASVTPFVSDTFAIRK